MAGIDDLIASESGAKSATPDIDSLISTEGGAPAQAAAPLPTPQNQPGFLSQLGRQIGLTGRAVGNGVADAAGVVVDPFNKLMGAKPLSGVIRNAVNANTPTPQGGVENAVQSVGSAVANPLNAVGGRLASTIGGIPGAIAGGAATAGMQPMKDDETLGDYAGNVALGGVGGGVLGGAANAVGRVLSPRAMSPAIADLMRRGVQPTPGQIIGGGANKLEQQLTSTPFVGDSIADARNRTIQQFNHAAYQDALDPLGATMPQGTTAGSDGVAAVRQAVGDAYDNLQGNALFNYDGQLHRDIAGIRNQLSQAAPQATVDQFDNILRNQITNKMDANTGEMTGPQWNTSRSMLSTFERNNRMGQPTADQTSLANAIGDLRDVMNQNVVRNSPPELQDDLNAANLAYARYKRIEGAAGSVGAMNNDNVFTPAQYMAAIRRGATASQRATGTGLNQDFATSAQALAGKVPDSGTTGRAGAVGALLAAPHLLAHPGLIAGGIGARAAYSPMGIRLLGSALTQRPGAVQAAGNAVQSLTAPGAVAGGLLLPSTIQDQPDQ